MSDGGDSPSREIPITVGRVRVLFGWELGAGLGHLLPYRGIFELLVAQGHELVVAARHVQKSQDALGTVPCRIVRAPVHDKAPQPEYRPTPTFAHVLHNSGFDVVDHIVHQAAEWDAIIAGEQPDVLLLNHAPALTLANRRHRLPAASLSTGFFVPPEQASSFRGVREDPKSALEARAVVDRINGALHVRDSLPIESVGQLLHEGTTPFLFTVEELDHYAGRLGVPYWGHLETPPAPAEAVWPSGKGPRVFAYLKPSAGLPRALAELAALGRATLVVADGIPEKVIETFESKTLQFSREPINLQSVANECDVFVGNANHATVLQLLLSGVPQIHLPLHLEQELVARNLVKMGAGLLVSARTGGGLADAVQIIDRDPRYRRAASRFAEKYGTVTTPAAIMRSLDEVFDSIRSDTKVARGDLSRRDR